MSLEMNKIIFLHGFFASGSCEPALAMKEGMAGEAEVLTPDLPLHPGEALRFVRSLVEAERPQLLVGNSCGSFYGQIVALACGLPALLGNPYFKMSEFLSQRRGVQHYKSPRRDGRQTFVIDDTLIGEFAAIEKRYNELKELAANVKKRPVVFSGEIRGGNWYAVGGKSFLAESPVLLAFSWCILMALNVTFSNVWGIILKEWKGVSAKTITVLVCGLLVLIFSLVFPNLF